MRITAHARGPVPATRCAGREPGLRRRNTDGTRRSHLAQASYQRSAHRRQAAPGLAGIVTRFCHVHHEGHEAPPHEHRRRSSQPPPAGAGVALKGSRRKRKALASSVDGRFRQQPARSNTAVVPVPGPPHGAQHKCAEAPSAEYRLHAEQPSGRISRLAANEEQAPRR